MYCHLMQLDYKDGRETELPSNRVTRGDFTVNGTDSSVLLPQINTDFFARLVNYDVANIVRRW
jgi:hypothetical protein